jgi:DNA replication protein DnaC
MLETFEARLAQARAGDLGHVEFLQALCEDEIARREAAGIGRRVRAARFEQVCAIEDYDFGYNPKIPAAHIRDLATLGFIEAGESVIFHGP